MGKIADKYRFLMIQNMKTLLLLEVTFKVIFCVFILPLLSFGLDCVIKLWGQSYITGENVLSFLSYPYTFLFFIFFIIIIAVYLLTKTTTMIHYCNIGVPYKNSNLREILSLGFRKSLRSIKSGKIALLFYTLLLYLLTNLPILIGITIYTHIDLLGGAFDEVFIKGLLICSLLFTSFIAYRSIFALHFCINEHQSFFRGMKESKMLLKGRNLKTVIALLLCNLGLTLGFYLIYYSVLFLTALLVYLFADKFVVIAVFLSVYPRINFYAFVFFGMIAFTTNLNLISSLYATYREKNFTEKRSVDFSFGDRSTSLQWKMHKHIVSGFLLLVIAAGLFNFYRTIKNDSFTLKEALSGIIITSHRGNSYVAPENTLPALENAIVARSDYAEIDIQQTKDGIIVLLHDKSLWRTAGLNRDIWSLTYRQVKELDAGYWFGKEFEHIKIPTLEEALALCKGRIKLNIEIKANGHENSIVEKLVVLIEQYDFEHQCVVTSTNYDTLIKVKQLNGEIKTGYIMSAAYGDFYNKDSIDFFSIRSKYISKSVVESVHSAGKEIHAWTVNTTSEINRMKSLGIDNIITDNPTLTREVLSLTDATKTFIELLNQMLNHRSFYRIVKQ